MTRGAGGRAAAGRVLMTRGAGGGGWAAAGRGPMTRGTGAGSDKHERQERDGF